ncbi:MAG TPA: argininosuccinate lyase [Methanomicrobia archaeon]|nr:argininosuccinate lyase [Methanomicrobia archaeon]
MLNRGGYKDEFILSLEADKWLFHADLLVDKAHVVMLKEQGIIKKEAAAILTCLHHLEERSADFIEHELPSYEDVHTAIESVVIAEVGEDIGGRMHTGRSRNDEVATCIRLALRAELLTLLNAINALRGALLAKAGEHIGTLMPGYTHLQHAQPTNFAHHLLAHADAFARDFARLQIAYERTNVCPLGAAAFASTGFPIDRERTARLLGFDAVLENSMDAVSTRDFVIEAISCYANLMTDLSRLAEELILWSSAEFNFIRLPNEYVTGSSIMPQKRNPDYAELVRARAGTVYGCLMSVLSICKALPYSYNRDLQEATPHLVRATKTTIASVTVMRSMVDGVEVQEERMAEQAPRGFSTATELADTIVRETGLPFRTAHTIVAALAAELTDETWESLRDEESAKALAATILQRIDALALSSVGQKLSTKGLSEKKVRETLEIATNLRKRLVTGGPAKKEVRRMLTRRKTDLEKDEKTRQDREEQVKKCLEELEKEVRRKKRVIKVIRKSNQNVVDLIKDIRK